MTVLIQNVVPRMRKNKILWVLMREWVKSWTSNYILGSIKNFIAVIQSRKQFRNVLAKILEILCHCLLVAGLKTCFLGLTRKPENDMSF